MYKKLFIIIKVCALLTFSTDLFAGTKNCGEVEITSMLSGPKHGSMMRVSNQSCGHLGWVCLDPESEFLTPTTSKRLYAQALSFHLSQKNILLTVYDDKFADACQGGYPVVYDLRTP